MLRVRELAAFYGASQALFGMELAVDAGEVVTLMGRNGMGKTTTVNAIMGLLAGAQRRRRVRGQPGRPPALLPHRPPRPRPGARGPPDLPQPLGAREPSGVGRQPHRRAAIPGPSSAPTTFFPRLAERQRNMGNQLSGGEQQMLAIGRALMTNPKLLILDEATEGLAPLIRHEIWSCLDRLKREGQAILVIDKSVGALIGLADRHHIVEKGRVVWTGTSDALARDSELQHRYLGV